MLKLSEADNDGEALGLSDGLSDGEALGLKEAEGL